MTDRTADTAPGLRQGYDDVDNPADNLLRHYVAVLRRRYRWVLLGLVAGLIAGFASTLFIKKPGPTTHYYKATASLITSGSQGSSADPGLQKALIYAQSSTFANAFSAKFGISTSQALQVISAQISPSASYPLLSVTALATDPAKVVNMANGAAKLITDNTNAAIIASAAQQKTQLQNQLNSLNSQYAALATQIASKPPNVADLQQQASQIQSQISDTQQQITQAANNTPDGQVIVQQPAVSIEINSGGYYYRIGQNQNARSPIQSGNTSSNNTGTINELDLSHAAPMSNTMRIAIGGAAGVVIGLITAFIFEAWDDRIRRREDVEKMTRIPVLSEIPRHGRETIRTHELAVIADDAGPIGERYRGARTALSLIVESHHAPNSPRRAYVFLITSPGPGDGKTTTAANVAAAFAETGNKTLVIDGDFRRPTIRRHLNPVPNLIDPESPASTVMDGLTFLAGPHNAQNPGVAINAISDMIDTWRSHYDIIILDTPPILTTNDAADLIHVADTVVVVVRAGQTRRRQAKRVVNLLERLQGDVAGIVVNACDRHDMDDYYGYGYGYYLRKGKGSKVDDGQTSSALSHNGAAHPTRDEKSDDHQSNNAPNPESTDDAIATPTVTHAD